MVVVLQDLDVCELDGMPASTSLKDFTLNRNRPSGIFKGTEVLQVFASP